MPTLVVFSDIFEALDGAHLGAYVALSNLDWYHLAAAEAVGACGKPARICGRFCGPSRDGLGVNISRKYN